MPTYQKRGLTLLIEFLKKLVIDTHKLKLEFRIDRGRIIESELELPVPRRREGSPLKREEELPFKLEERLPIKITNPFAKQQDYAREQLSREGWEALREELGKLLSELCMGNIFSLVQEPIYN